VLRWLGQAHPRLAEIEPGSPRYLSLLRQIVALEVNYLALLGPAEPAYRPVPSSLAPVPV